MHTPLRVQLCTSRPKINDYHVGDKIRFVRTVDRHDQAEHPDPLPPISTGTVGEVLENTGTSVLIAVAHPADPARISAVRLYPSGPDEEDCSIDAIRLCRDMARTASQTIGFSGKPDQYLEAASERRSRLLEAVWPREPIG